MKKSTKRLVWEYTEAIVTALLLALFIRAYFIQAFKIPTGSMIPTLLVGDHILVNKFLYGVRLPFSENKILAMKKPKRGDIIVFKYPEDPKRDFIKRVIAVEGDMIDEKNRTVFINGRPVEEIYARHTDEKMSGAEPKDNFGPLIVPKDKYFVMGDNRDQSYDSRFWGFVDTNEIKGKALIIYWSWDRERFMPRLGRFAHIVR